MSTSISSICLNKDRYLNVYELYGDNKMKFIKDNDFCVIIGYNVITYNKNDHSGKMYYLSLCDSIVREKVYKLEELPENEYGKYIDILEENKNIIVRVYPESGIILNKKINQLGDKKEETKVSGILYADNHTVMYTSKHEDGFLYESVDNYGYAVRLSEKSSLEYLIKNDVVFCEFPEYGRCVITGYSNELNSKLFLLDFNGGMIVKAPFSEKFKEHFPEISAYLETKENIVSCMKK